jgi:hypothetical protein
MGDKRKQKFGEGHVAAMVRLGFKELRNAINPSRESVADNEIGLYGSQTQGEIAQARKGPGHGPEQEQKEEKEKKNNYVSLDDLRAFAKELSQADRSREHGKEQAKEQGHEQDRGGHEM